MKYHLLIFSILFSFSVFSQYTINGKVIDENGKPIPYANIFFKGTSVGTYSNKNGDFSLKTEKKNKTLIISLLGYTTKEIHWKNKHNKPLQIVLSEGQELEEVTIVAKPKKRLSKKENPAYKILQQIWKNKRKNGLQQANYYQYQKYSSTELGLNNLDSTFLKQTLSSDYQNIRNLLSDKKYKQFFTMPMYLKEEVEQVYGDNIQQKKRTDLSAERTQGIAQTGFGLERFSRAFPDFNIYDNTYLILDKNFVSPLSEFGYGVYSYVLNDSIQKNGQKFYTIYFFPREDQDLAFQGHFVVNNRNFSVESIQMHTLKETNINLVRSLSFEKYFQQVNDSIFLPQKDIYEGDFSVFTDEDNKKGLYVKKNIIYDNFVLNEPKSSNFYSEEILKTHENQFQKNSDYWQNFSGISQEKSKTQYLIEKVSQSPKIQTITNIIDVLGTGYLRLNKFIQYGSLWESYAANDVEGGRFRIGMRSFITPQDRFRTYGFFAYGTRDKQVKYGISVKYLLNHRPRITIGAEFKNDYLQLGSVLPIDDTTLGFRKPFALWFARGENFYLTHNKLYQGIIDFSSTDGNLHLTLLGAFQQMKSADEKHFSIDFMKNQKILSAYNDAHFGISLTYTPKRNVYGYGVEQRYGRNLHNIYRLKYTKGFSQIGDFQYNKFDAMANFYLPIWSVGTLQTTIEAGKTFGVVPLVLLNPTPANQTYSLLDRSFALLDYYDFINDTYVNLHLEHHFNGFLFNRIPWVKKSKLRSLIFARMAWGSISEENKKASKTNLIYNPATQPYWEYGFGIENIGLSNFRFFRFDLIWRTDFNDVNGVKNPYFGFRVKIRPEF